NCAEALLAAGLVRAFVAGAPRLDSLRNAGIVLAAAAIVAPLSSSFLDAALVRLAGWGTSDYWELVHARVYSNVLAEVTVVPLLLLAVALDERRRNDRESHAQLTHLSRVSLLGELSGGIAHELNQPLTAILSNAQAAQHFLANKNAEPGLLSEILQDIITAD